jgi:hypothetical protein
MTIQTIDPRHIAQKTRQIMAQVSAVLTLPRFKRWRLTQDPDTGIIVLFGIFNNKYIATHTLTPFSDYFDPRLLQDLANELQVQAVSCNSDGLRYAFILDRGQLGEFPTHIDFPFVDNGELSVGVVYGDHPQLAPTVPTQTVRVQPVQIQPVPIQPVPTPPVGGAIVEDQTFVRQSCGSFLEGF